MLSVTHFTLDDWGSVYVNDRLVGASDAFGSSASYVLTELFRHCSEDDVEYKHVDLLELKDNHSGVDDDVEMMFQDLASGYYQKVQQAFDVLETIKEY